MLMSELCKVALRAAGRGHILRPKNENGRVYVCSRCEADITLDRSTWTFVGDAIHNDCVDLRLAAKAAEKASPGMPEGACA